ncbi:hypothetical protein K493DRAFT_298221 [Basidiobolus meristosporus CBS 931.73]|uniref:Uncharacterized protein n=1 Tax=Basidiobolus meristosporus CBS 931.73 TaxID=1314790 RepID=A0A1Y1YUS0_9FUNG|nr:hypothetical protein K493DRAFT_298221 [Basidiobolus meristosporus CBS 931.73]|eukprot:ORY01778.1 hypothetical protein K493DRAFT_298221 [Basidiobolus meristosporus CBS 931.73]
MWRTLIMILGIYSATVHSSLILQDMLHHRIWGSASLGVYIEVFVGVAGYLHSYVRKVFAPDQAKLSGIPEPNLFSQKCVRRIGYEANEFGLCREAGELGTSCGGVSIEGRQNVNWDYLANKVAAFQTSQENACPSYNPINPTHHHGL